MPSTSDEEFLRAVERGEDVDEFSAFDADYMLTLTYAELTELAVFLARAAQYLDVPLIVEQILDMEEEVEKP